MNIICEKAALQKGITTAIRGVSSKNTTIPALEGILIKASKKEDGTVSLTGFNGEMGIQCELSMDVRQEGNMVFPARLFSEIVRKLPDDYVTIETDGVKAHISCGNSEYDLTVMDAEDFPEIPEAGEGEVLEIEERRLKTAISKTSFAVSQDESRPIHTGIQIRGENGKLTAVAIDGFRVAFWREELSGGQDGVEMVVPGNAMGEVEKICEDGEDTVQITAGKQHIFFQKGRTSLFCRRLYGDFLDYRKVVPKTSTVKVIVNRKELSAAVDRMALLASAATEKLKTPLVMDIGKESISVKTTTATGKATDIVAAQIEGDGFTIGFNHRYVLDALKVCPEEVCLRMNSSNEPCVITPTNGKKNCVYMILPVRVHAE